MTPDSTPPAPDPVPPVPESYRTFWDSGPADPAPPPATNPDAYAAFAEQAEL